MLSLPAFVPFLIRCCAALLTSPELSNLLKSLGRGSKARLCYGEGFCWCQGYQGSQLAHSHGYYQLWPAPCLFPPAGTGGSSHRHSLQAAHMQRHTKAETPNKYFVCIDTKCSLSMGTTTNSSPVYPGSSQPGPPLGYSDAH